MTKKERAKQMYVSFPPEQMERLRKLADKAQLSYSSLARMLIVEGMRNLEDEPPEN